MISAENLSTLLPASEALAKAKEVADTAVEHAIARAINCAVNASPDGTIMATYNGEIPSATLNKLKQYNYDVRLDQDAYGNDIPNMYIISAR